MSDYDVIVIGTGAGGGTLARHLAPSGKRILLLERGGWLAREPQNWAAHDVFVDNRYVSPDTWYDEQDRAFQPQVHYFVGGDEALRCSAVPTARGGLRRAAPPRRHLARVAHRVRRDGAVLHARRAALPGARGPR
jgi:choline dehydrogenase-like flavoprotein